MIMRSVFGLGASFLSLMMLGCSGTERGEATTDDGQAVTACSSFREEARFTTSTDQPGKERIGGVARFHDGSIVVSTNAERDTHVPSRVHFLDARLKELGFFAADPGQTLLKPVEGA